MDRIAIAVFTIIVWLMFRQMPRWNNMVAFLLAVAAVYFTFNFDRRKPRRSLLVRGS